MTAESGLPIPASNINAGKGKKIPAYNDIFSPDDDVTAIRLKGFVIKVSNNFIRENENCALLLYGGEILVKVTVTDGRIDEYESLPGRMGERFGAKQYAGPVQPHEEGMPVAWLFINNRNERLYHKHVQGDDIC